MAQQTNSQIPAVATPTLVDSTEFLASFLLQLNDLLTHPPTKTLYLDLEGIKLSRDGTLSLLTLLIHGSPKPSPIFLIDVHVLGSSAFTTTPAEASLTGQPLSLKAILESPTTTKVLFDVRNDADALYSHFGVKLQGVVDVQLMENAARRGNKRVLHGLAKCIREDCGLSTAEKANWEEVKDKGLKLFASEKGGRPDIFNVRPLSQDLKTYCVQDVTCLPALHELYSGRLDAT